jgi:hypothetical protein
MTTTPNDQLVSKVRAAVTAKVALETSVGEKPLVNTFDGPPIENLRRLSIVRDPEHPDEHIDGTTTVFFGIITPP